jgi:hypothetical protein
MPSAKNSHQKIARSPQAVVPDPSRALRTNYHIPQPRASDTVEPIGVVPEPTMSSISFHP